jgi:hypothetical protein
MKKKLFHRNCPVEIFALAATLSNFVVNRKLGNKHSLFLSKSIR